MHREQGTDHDQIIIDCQGIDYEAMFYTAASRVTHGQGMHLKNFDQLSIKCNQIVVDLYELKHEEA